MSNWIRGNAADWKGLSDELIEAATGSSISAPVINAAGTGYTVGDILTVVGGTSTIVAQIEVVAITGGGGTGPIDTMRMYNAGVYTATPSLTANAVTGGTGSSATVDLTYASNGWTMRRNQGNELSAVDSVVAGGTGYAVDDIITLTGGTFNIVAKLKVLTLSGSAVATVSIEDVGDYTVIPTDPVAQGSVAPTGGSGATFNLTFEDGERTVILEGNGGGSDEIFIGWRTFSDVPGDWYNLELHGMTGFSSALPFKDQPGISPGFYEEASIADFSGAYLVTTSVSFNYFININSYRIIVETAVGSVYNPMYLGWGNRFATSTEYPYPMVVAGSASRPEITPGESVKHSTIVDPWAINGGDLGPMKVYGTDGVWYDVRNRGATSPLDDRCVVPAQRPNGVSGAPSLPEDRFMTAGVVEFHDLIFSTSTGSGGAANMNLLPAGASDYRLLLPAIVVFSVPSSQVLLELDECFLCNVFGGITNEDRFIDDSGVAYRIFQNCNRTDNYSYIAIKEAS